LTQQDVFLDRGTQRIPYRIRVNGHLDASWQEWLEGLQITHEEADTTLFAGSLQEQAALCGVLLTMHQLGLSWLWLDMGESSGPEERP
jgi:hypothetical protein